MNSSQLIASVNVLPPELNWLPGHQPAPHAGSVGPGVRSLAVTAALLVLGGCSLLQRLNTPGAPITQPAAAPEHPPEAETTSQAATSRSAEVRHQTAAVATTVASAPDVAASGRRRDASASLRKTPTGESHNALGAADVGYYMDVLQGRLTQAIGKEGRIERRGDSIVLLLPMGFDIDGSQLNPAGQQVLRALTGILVEYRFTLVSVQIRCVDSDAACANSLLASGRAEALSKDLAEAGIAAKRIATSGVGARLPEPPAAADQPGGTRVEWHLSPIVMAANLL